MYHEGERHNLGVIQDGAVVESFEENFEDWVRDELSHPTTPDIDDPEAILAAYDGPHLVAKTVDDGETVTRNSE